MRRWLPLWLIASAVLALALMGQIVVQHVHQAQQADTTSSLHFAWAFHPKSFREARDSTDLIVLANVASVQRGADIVVPVKGLPNGEDRVPTQRITVNVEKVYRGQAAKGQTLVLFQTGGGSTGFSEDDPAYQPGERYALLLVPGPNGCVRFQTARLAALVFLW